VAVDQKRTIVSSMRAGFPKAGDDPLPLELPLPQALAPEPQISSFLTGTIPAQLRQASTHKTALCLTALLVAGGAAAPLLVAELTPKAFSSHAQIKISASAGALPDMDRFVTDARANIFSTSGIARTIRELRLEGTEFAAARKVTSFDVFLDILGGAEAPAVLSEDTLQNQVADAVTLSANPATGDIGLSVAAANPVITARLANYLAIRLVSDVDVPTNDPLAHEVANARAAIEKTEAALSGFKLIHPDISTTEMLDIQRRLQQLDATDVATQARVNENQRAVTAISSIKAENLLEKSLPRGDVFLPLEALSQKYAAAKMALAEASVHQGPKHPRVITARIVVEGVRAEVRPLLQRVAADIKLEEKQIAAELAALAEERERLNARLTGLGDGPKQLEALEAGLENARSAYLAALDRHDGITAAPLFAVKISEQAAPGIAAPVTYPLFASGIGGALGLACAAGLLLVRRRAAAGAEEAGLEEEDQASNYDDLIFDDAVPLDADTPLPITAAFNPLDLIDDDDIVPAAAQVLPTEEIFEQRFDYPQADNDVPWADHVRQVLMDGRVVHSKMEGASILPPLLAAALEGDFQHRQPDPQELEAMRREVAVLRERLQGYATRRTSSGR
jgi:uncharacterized protein involved in exopolysaccharide biosynthesis